MYLNSYLVFNGQCEEAFRFYEQLLGGKIENIMTFRGSPMENHIPPEHLDKVMHGRVRFPGGILMGSDPPPGRYEQPKGSSVHLGVDEPGEADRIFQALAEGGSVIMPIQQTFWARRFGMLVDRFGTPWMVNCE
jgi:PhnB protein